MVEYGDPQRFSAMARLVGLPTAIAAEMLLEGQYIDLCLSYIFFTFLSGSISRTGVVEPLYPEIYEPILQKLKEAAVNFKVVSHS